MRLLTVKIDLASFLTFDLVIFFSCKKPASSISAGGEGDVQEVAVEPHLLQQLQLTLCEEDVCSQEVWRGLRTGLTPCAAGPAGNSGAVAGGSRRQTATERTVGRRGAGSVDTVGQWTTAWRGGRQPVRGGRPPPPPPPRSWELALACKMARRRRRTPPERPSRGRTGRAPPGGWRGGTPGRRWSTRDTCRWSPSSSTYRGKPRRREVGCSAILRSNSVLKCSLRREPRLGCVCSASLSHFDSFSSVLTPRLSRCHEVVRPFQRKGSIIGRVPFF